MKLCCLHSHTPNIFQVHVQSKSSDFFPYFTRGIQYCPKVLDPHFDEFPGFSGFLTKFRLKRKFGDISANFRDAYCPNPRELSNDISLCSKYRGENSAKIRRKSACLENSLRIFERTFVRFSKRFRGKFKRHDRNMNLLSVVPA